MRWYYVHVCRLLDPNHGINILKKQTYRIIDKHSKRAEKYAQYNIKLTVLQNNEVSEEHFKAIFYQQESPAKNFLCHVIKELTTISVKSIDCLNLSVTTTALEAIKNISYHYLRKRENNLQITQTLALVAQSDEDNLLSLIYEQFEQIGQYALSKNNESICLLVCQQYCDLIIFLSTITIESTSLIYLPISYLKNTIKKSQEKLILEVSFQSAQKILNLTCSLPNHTNSETYESLIDLLYEISLYLLVTKSSILTNEVVAKNVQIIHHLLSKNNYQLLSETLKYTLEKFRVLTLASLLYEKKHSKKLMFTPMSGVYSLTSKASLGYLFGGIAEKVGNENSSYDDFFDISTHIYSHFNDMAREFDFGSNMIVHDIMYSIKHILEWLIYL